MGNSVSMGNSSSMDNAVSIINGQVSIGCQLCETGETIVYKCLVCDLLMCKRCKEKVHPKFPNAKDHKIIDIKDIGKDNGVELCVVKEFQTEFPVVASVCPCPDNSLWIYSGIHSFTLRKLMLGDHNQSPSNFNIKFCDMTVTPNNDLLLATVETRLKQITDRTETIKDSIYNIIPFLAVSVHVSKDFKVMVGAVGNGGQVVIIMNKKGEQLSVYQQDKQNQPLFTYPKRITSTSNNTIFVTDGRMTDRHGGRMVILNQSGDVQYYTGHTDVNKTTPFSAEGLTTTPNDNVIVADLHTNTLHIFNNSGQLITFYNTYKNKGILPYSLEFSLSGHLFVGGTRRAGNSDKAKLYQVNISGC